MKGDKIIWVFFSDKSTCLIITLSKYDWYSRWEEEKVKKRGEDYDGLKNAIGKQMWNQCIQLFPKLEGRVSLFIFLFILTIHVNVYLENS